MNDEPSSSRSCPRCGRQNLRGRSRCDGCDAELPGSDIAPKPTRLEHESDVSALKKKHGMVEFIAAIGILAALATSFAVNPVIGAPLTAGVGITLSLVPKVRRNRGCLFLLGLALTLLTTIIVVLGGAVFIAFVIICKPYQ